MSNADKALRHNFRRLEELVAIFSGKLAGVVTAVTGVPPIASSGGPTPAISIAPATPAAAGSLSGADKTKLNAYPPVSGLTVGNVLTATGAGSIAFQALPPASTVAIGAFNTRPPQGQPAGSLFYATDGIVSEWISDGTVWRPFIDGTIGTEPPHAANWNNLGGVLGGAAVADDRGSVKFTQSTVSDALWRYTGALNPSFQIVTATAQSANPNATGNPGFGVAVRNANVTGANVGYVRSVEYTAQPVLHDQIQPFRGAAIPGPPNPAFFDLTGVPPANTWIIAWYRTTWNVATQTLTFEKSTNRQDWVTLYSTTPFEAAAAGQFCIMPMQANSNTDDICRLLSMDIS